MNTLLKILADAVYFFGSFYISLIVVRVILQKVRADYYNPLFKGIIKFTNPVVLPARKIIPGFFGIDFASVVVALLLQMLVVFLIFLLKDSLMIPPLYLFVRALLELLDLVLIIYLFGIILLAIVSWVAPDNYNPAVSLLQQMLSPVMRPFRRLLPPMSGMDFSPMLLGFVIFVLRQYALPELSGFLTHLIL